MHGRYSPFRARWMPCDRDGIPSGPQMSNTNTRETSNTAASTQILALKFDTYADIQTTLDVSVQATETGAAQFGYPGEYFTPLPTVRGGERCRNWAASVRYVTLLNGAKVTGFDRKSRIATRCRHERGQHWLKNVHSDARCIQRMVGARHWPRLDINYSKRCKKMQYINDYNAVHQHPPSTMYFPPGTITSTGHSSSSSRSSVIIRLQRARPPTSIFSTTSR